MTSKTNYNMNSTSKKDDQTETERSLKGSAKNSDILFGLDLSKEKEGKFSPLREQLELSESRSIPHNSNLNLNFLNKFPFLER